MRPVHSQLIFGLAEEMAAGSLELVAGSRARDFSNARPVFRRYHLIYFPF